MTPDVNVLVAASRSDHPHHTVARPWLERAAVSSPMIFLSPTPVEDAVAFVDALLEVRGVRLASLGPEWPRLRQLCLDKQLKGNDLPDAWLAAATLHLGEHLVSFDRDFKRLIGRSQFTLLEPQTE